MYRVVLCGTHDALYMVKGAREAPCWMPGPVVQLLWAASALRVRKNHLSKTLQNPILRGSWGMKRLRAWSFCNFYICIYGILVSSRKKGKAGNINFTCFLHGTLTHIQYCILQQCTNSSVTMLTKNTLKQKPDKVFI